MPLDSWPFPVLGQGLFCSGQSEETSKGCLVVVVYMAGKNLGVRVIL